MQSAIALSLGALSLSIYFCVIGVVLVRLLEIDIYSLISYFPKAFHSTLFLLTSHFIEILVAVPILGIAGLLIGMIADKRPLLFGGLGFIGALGFFFSNHNGELLWIDSVPIWSQILPFFIWLSVYLCSSWVGHIKLKKYFAENEERQNLNT